MKVEEFDGSIEKKIVTGMIVNHTVCGQVAAKWDKNMLRNRWANVVAQWCADYYKKYSKAPEKKIFTIYEVWVEKEPRDKETVQLVGAFLSVLSEEYEQETEDVNPDYILDLCKDHFLKVAYRRLGEDLQNAVEDNDVVEAQAKFEKFRPIEVGQSAWVDPLRDKEIGKSVFSEDKRKILISYEGALGNFFGHSLCRDAFIALVAPEKSGKSFVLLDMAMRGVEQRRKVAFFEVGDMSQDQVMERIYARVSGRPMLPGKVRWPKFIEKTPGERFASVDYDTKEYKEGLNFDRAWEGCLRILEEKVKSKRNLFRLSCHPNSTINVSGIRAVLDDWKRFDNWIPDVLVIDYADILAPMVGIIDSREQINLTWKHLRSLNQQLHCLLITATQSDANAYDAYTITRSNFSEDKRKNAHVTGMIGINATDEEKDKGIIRFNWTERRSERFSVNEHVHIATCLELANPCVLSTY